MLTIIFLAMSFIFYVTSFGYIGSSLWLLCCIKSKFWKNTDASICTLWCCFPTFPGLWFYFTTCWTCVWQYTLQMCYPSKYSWTIFSLGIWHCIKIIFMQICKVRNVNQGRLTFPSYQLFCFHYKNRICYFYFSVTNFRDAMLPQIQSSHVIKIRTKIT